jgi:serine protease
MVAGIIGASSNNTAGVAGLCWGCQILPVKVLDSNASGSYSNIASGITYAADHGARIINLSLGGTSASTTLQNAVTYAVGKGALVVAAAGNTVCNCIMYPAAYSNALAVGAVDSNNNNVAAYGSALDVVAPGSNWSTYYNTSFPNTLYAVLTGTSSAAPVVAGLAALLMTQNPTWTAADVTAKLESTATDLGSAGWDSTYGAGLVDFAAALGTASVRTAPSPTGTPGATPTPTPSPAPTPTPTPTATPAPTPTPAPTATPTPTSSMLTATYSGTVNSKQKTRSYSVSCGTGTMIVALKVNSGSGLQLSVLAPDGTALATSSAASPTVTVTVTGGSYTIKVTGSGTKASFTLTVTYPS